MRLLIVLIVLLISQITLSQSMNGIDTLEKYSYLVLHMSKGNAIGNSTGFFIRNNKKTFFITTYHTCSCVDVFKKEIYNPEWDMLYIRLYNDSNQIIYSPLILEPIKINRVVEYFFDHPDICIYEMKHLPTNINVNSVETFADNYSRKKGDPQKTIFFGYARENIDTAIAETLSSIRHVGEMKYGIDHTITFVDINRVDTTSLTITPPTKHGASGSPVFFQFETDKGTLTTFGGMVFGTSESEDLTYVVRPELIIERIKKVAK